MYFKAFEDFTDTKADVFFLLQDSNKNSIATA